MEQAKMNANLAQIEGLEGLNDYQYKLMVYTDEFKNRARTGIVNIEPIKQNKQNDPYNYFFNYKDDQERVIYGIPEGIDKNTGQIIGKWERLVLHGPMQFDLSKNRESILWFIYQNCPFMKGSKWPNPGQKPSFEWYIAEEKAEKNLEKFEKLNDCYAFLRSLDDAAHMEFSLAILGHVASVQSRTLSLSMIMDMAKLNVHDVYKHIKDRNRTAMLAVLRIMEAANVVSTMAGKGYLTLDNNSIGMNEEQAVNFLMENPRLADQWKTQARAKLKSSNGLSFKAETPETKQVVAPPAFTGTIQQEVKEEVFTDPLANRDIQTIDELTELPPPDAPPAKKTVAKGKEVTA